MSNKQSGGTRGASGSGKSEMDLAMEEYTDYTHGGTYLDEKEGAYSHMDVLFEKNPLEKDIVLFRGGTMGEMQAMAKMTDANNPWDLEGKTLVSNQYLSTSSNSAYAKEYMSDVVESYQEEADSDWGAHTNVVEWLESKEKFSETPVLSRYHVAKGSKVIERSKFTDTVGRGGSSEYTIGHGNKMKITSIDIDTHEGPYNSYDYTVVDIEVKRKK